MQDNCCEDIWIGVFMPIFLADNLKFYASWVLVKPLELQKPEPFLFSFLFSFCPVMKHFFTIMTNNMKIPFLVLVTKWNFKINFIGKALKAILYDAFDEKVCSSYIQNKRYQNYLHIYVYSKKP